MCIGQALCGKVDNKIKYYQSKELNLGGLDE